MTCRSFSNRAEGGTNLVAMECMAAGVPTIVSNNTLGSNYVGGVVGQYQNGDAVGTCTGSGLPAGSLITNDKLLVSIFGGFFLGALLLHVTYAR